MTVGVGRVSVQRGRQRKRLAEGNPSVPDLVAPEGPFTVDFSDYPDGPVPSNTWLHDAFLQDVRQDEMGIRDGKLAVVKFRGADGPTDPFGIVGSGGRRGYLWRNTVTLTNNVYGPVEVPVSGAAGNVGGSPVLHVNTGSQWQGIACWFIPPPYSWTELGLIGREIEDFSYLDLHPGTSMPVPGDDIRLRSIDGYVSLEVNGRVVCGPCVIPADLLGSTVHGVQIDVSADADEAVGMVDAITINTDAGPLGTRAAPLTPNVGSPVETASATTINVPYPAGIAAGNSLYCIVATKNGGTISASGWTDVVTNFGIVAGLGIRCLRKTATGAESGNLTVTKSTAGIMAGVMVRVTGDQSASAMSGQGNSSSSTSMPSPALQIFGPKRTVLWLGATNIDVNITGPTGFIPLSVGLAGAQAVRLYVGVTFLDQHPDFPTTPIFNAFAASHFPAQTGTAASATTSAVGMLILHPAAGTAISARLTEDGTVRYQEDGTIVRTLEGP